jgi:hypothetical protein
MNTVPIVDKGWWFLELAGVHVSYLAPSLSDQSYARYIRAMANEIDSTPDSRRRCVFSDVPEPTAGTPARRKMVADMLDSRRDKLARITTGFAMATPSAITRGALTAVFWLAPPPYSWRVVEAPKDAFKWFATLDPAIVPAVLTAQYERVRPTLIADCA